MSTTTAAVTRAATGEPTATRTAVTVAALAGALASAAHVASVIFMSDLSHRDAARHPLVLAANLITGLAFVALAVTLPALARCTRIPHWPLRIVAAGCAFAAVITWTVATYIPHIQGILTETQAQQAADETTIYFHLYSLPKMALLAVGLTALAITGWRRHAFTRPAAALLIAAAAVSLALPPPWPGTVLTGLALAWIARSAPPNTDT